MYAKIINGVVEKYPYSIGELRKDNPNTSFPKNIPANVLAEFNVFPVESVAQPSTDYTKNVQEGPIANDNGWKQTWVVVDASAEEIAERTGQVAAGVRGERDQLLNGCDWTQVADAPVDKAAWATYRQALRDVPSQAGFPHNVTWPAKPE